MPSSEGPHRPDCSVSNCLIIADTQEMELLFSSSSYPQREEEPVQRAQFVLSLSLISSSRP
jgi:hypothetical protein